MENDDKAISTPADDTETNSTTAGSSKRGGLVTLLIENPGKGKNWGPLLRCCAAFGIGTIFVVGYDRCDVRGSHGASKHVQLRAFPTHERAVEALKAVHDEDGGDGGFELVGLLSPFPDQSYNRDTVDTNTDIDDHDSDKRVVRETFLYPPTETEMDVVRIAATATPATSLSPSPPPPSSFPAHRTNKYPKRICLVIDKLKRGLPWSLAKHCTSFVHIPHANFQACGTGGSMLTLEASVSIVFHELLSCGTGNNWLGYTEDEDHEETTTNTTNNNNNNNNEHSSTSDYKGQKYHVETVHKGGNPDDEQARHRKRKEREEKLEELQMEAEEQQHQQSSLFGADNDGDY
uniref:tRNA/rRNA methyltransferase SpoU type domain-containing protein n=1 Tax=Pseudo-nitzschia australis TaxID=44445 RepID=A0A6V0AU61_9STRA|mmetsp:Transcript_14515/g.29704  ORF Transcript_14515/g.29704 Transcript_14515/m.29704 type:complete len:347 (-) Transcript_14515:605-1645(-)